MTMPATALVPERESAHRVRRTGLALVGLALALVAFALALAVPVPAVSAGGGDAKPPRSSAHAGRVVRVERPRMGVAGTPRVCNFYPQSGPPMCWGVAVTVGEEAVVVGMKGVVGRIRVTEVTPADCVAGLNYLTFAYEVVIGDVTSSLEMLNVLFDVEVHDSGKSVDTAGLRAPSQSDLENPWTAFDRDGDQITDLIVTAYACDDQGLASSTSSGPFCMDYWFLGGVSWRKVRHDLVGRCQ